jgi:hypothetical protein
MDQGGQRPAVPLGREQLQRRDDGQWGHALTDCILTCGGQISFTNLNFADSAFTLAPGGGDPPCRGFALIEAAWLGTATFANASGTISGKPARLYLSGNTHKLALGRPCLVLNVL